MADEQKLYDCVCFKCAANYKSCDERDTDGDGKCPPCKEKAKVIATNVQKIIDQRRANRGAPPPAKADMPSLKEVPQQVLKYSARELL